MGHLIYSVLNSQYDMAWPKKNIFEKKIFSVNFVVLFSGTF